jgi:hypothetical protein
MSFNRGKAVIEPLRAFADAGGAPWFHFVGSTACLGSLGVGCIPEGVSP